MREKKKDARRKFFSKQEKYHVRKMHDAKIVPPRMEKRIRKVFESGRNFEEEIKKEC